MPQSLLILRKDIQHLWPETLIVLALFGAFAFSAPSGWAGSEYAGYVTVLAFLLKILMPISWLVVISRLIQDEPLVGDRQFWTSRPYHWAKLFLAKILFLLAFIYLPFFLMQVYLLKRAGLHPLTVLPALGHNLLLLTVVLIIPIAAISAVTSTFARLLLSTLGALIYLLIVIGILGWVSFLHMMPPHLDWLLNGIFIVLPAAALLYQYRTRRTLTSRILLLVTPLIAAVIVLSVPTTSLIAHAYPVLSDTSAPRLTSFGEQFHPPVDPSGHLATFRGNVNFNLPVRVEGVGDDANFVLQGVRATVKGSGVDYSSPFLTALGGGQINAGSPASLLTFTLPLAVFNKIRTLPVDLHLQLAAEHLKADKPSTWKATLAPFSVPGKGLCTFSPDDASLPPTCRYPLVQPEISFVTAPMSAGSCATPPSQPIKGRGSIGGKGSTLDFDPVITVPLTLRTGDPNPQDAYLLCPGTDLTFIEATKLADTSLAFDAKGIVLDPYAVRLTAQSATPHSGISVQPRPTPQ